MRPGSPGLALATWQKPEVVDARPRQRRSSRLDLLLFPPSRFSEFIANGADFDPFPVICGTSPQTFFQSL